MLGYYRRKWGGGGNRRPPCKNRRKQKKGGSEKDRLKGGVELFLILPNCLPNVRENIVSSLEGRKVPYRDWHKFGIL